MGDWVVGQALEGVVVRILQDPFKLASPIERWFDLHTRIPIEIDSPLLSHHIMTHLSAPPEANLFPSLA